MNVAARTWAHPLVGAICLWASAWAADRSLDISGFLEEYCIDCHDGGIKRGGLDLEKIAAGGVGEHADVWEHVIRRMGARQMPPRDEDHRPDEATYTATLEELTGFLDGRAAKAPDPGHVDAVRRMTRTEYQNAIRDLLGVEVDVTELLPKDESSHGFDNITVGSLSPTLLNRYISAAQKISRVAVGGDQGSAQVRIVRTAPDRTQEEHVEGLPLGTRGGLRIKHTFPVTGEYEVEVRLTRDRDEKVEGLNGQHVMEVLVDGVTEAEFTVRPPKKRDDFTDVDAHLKKRIRVEAGTRELGVTFVRNGGSLMETKREPYDAQFNVHRHPRQSPAVYQVSLLGPMGGGGGGGKLEQGQPRAMVFTRLPESAENEVACARESLERLMRKAYRRPVSEEDFAGPMAFFEEGREEGGFEKGMESALSAVLVSPQFLFRVEADPDGAVPGEVYRVDDLTLASRLSYFLWSSLPDDELLEVAARGELSKPEVMVAQVRRMLADERADSLTTNFADQWLHLRNLDSVNPDLRMFPDFDDNLREAFKTETRMFFQNMVEEDRSVVDLLKADFAFLNERLAKHYGIPNVYGSRFRRVKLDDGSHRGGLLRQGSILTVTSYANRTSPVIRGNWVLSNILGTPTPPPPANVPSLDDVVIAASLPMRARLGKHREDKSCATCHNLMDPPGFAFENYDAVGRWREREGESWVDASGGLPDGQEFVGVEGLEEGLLKRPGIFARTVTEKLLTYALGRGVETCDAPAVRKILAKAEKSDYKLSEIILGIAESVPFTLKKAHVPD